MIRQITSAFIVITLLGILFSGAVCARAPKDALQKADRLISEGKMNEARSLLLEMVKEDKNNAAACDRLAYVSMASGASDEAENYAKMAVKLDGTLAISWNILGMAEERRGNNAQAAEFYQKAVKNDPSYAKAYNNLGNIYLKCSDFTNAEKTYRKALSMDPGLAMAHNNLAYVLELQGKAGEAKSEYEKALKIKPDLEMAQNNLKHLQEKQGASKVSGEEKALAQGICHFETPEGYVLVKAMSPQGGGKLALFEYHFFQKTVLRELPKDNKINETVFAQMIVDYKQELIALLEGLMEIRDMKIAGQGYVEVDRRKVLYVSTVFDYGGSRVEGMFTVITNPKDRRSVLIMAIAPRGLYQRVSTEAFLKHLYFER